MGYLSRPFGGILFGHLGDRRGRRFVLVITLLMMGVTHHARSACCPPTTQVGVLAPILLVTLRFLQGMALGGEWAGAVLLSVEHGTGQATRPQRGLRADGAIDRHADRHRRDRADSPALHAAELCSRWGWRLPLLASVVLVVFGLWLRLGVPETPQFRAARAGRSASRAPLGEVLRQHWRRC